MAIAAARALALGHFEKILPWHHGPANLDLSLGSLWKSPCSALVNRRDPRLGHLHSRRRLGYPEPPELLGSVVTPKLGESRRSLIRDHRQQRLFRRSGPAVRGNRRWWRRVPRPGESAAPSPIPGGPGRSRADVAADHPEAGADKPSRARD